MTARPDLTATSSPLAPGPAAVARTLLIVPGDRPERFAKAAPTAAYLVIVDIIRKAQAILARAKERT